MSKVILISVKPEFADKICSGIKTIELRKSTPKVEKDDIVVIYSTLPVKAVVGICRVKEIVKTSPSELWALHSTLLGIDEERYIEYYKDSEVAVGIVLTSVFKLHQAISLYSIKQWIPEFNPPQTFRYFNKNEILRGYKLLQYSLK